MRRRSCLALAPALLLHAALATGESPPDAPPASTHAAPSAPAPSAPAHDAQPSTTLSAAGYFFVVPDGPNYLQPMLAVDHSVLHLEARYSYEDLLTGSVWGGYNLSGGTRLEWELTPIGGAVFGRTNGLSLGYEGALSYWLLELYSESEFVFVFEDVSEGFFYNWSELSLAPVAWLRFGLVVQRTRVYQTEREFSRGFLAGVGDERANLTAYIFNPDDSQPVVAVAVTASFDP